MVSGNFPQLFDKSFRKIYFDNFKRVENEWKAFPAKFETSSEHSVKEGSMYGLGAMQIMHESQATPMEKFGWGGQKEAYHTEFGLGLIVSNILFEDDLTGHVKKGIAELGKAAGYTKDLRFWDVINSGTLAVRIGVDGLPLFSAVHPLFGVIAGTQSNIVTGALSKSTLQTACDRFWYLQNDKGVPVISKPTTLWVPYQQRWKAKELLKSALDPDTGNNAINTMYDEGITYKVGHFLTDPYACYLVGTEHDVRFINRREAQFMSYDDPNTRSSIFKGDMRFTTTFFDWRGVVKITGV
jgi:hypothetical protein